MKLIASLFLGALSCVAQNADRTCVDGTWRVTYTDPRTGFKAFSEVLFSVKADQAIVTGMVHLGSWPGNAEIVNGRLDGDRVSFTVIGTQGSSTGYPRIRFEGTLRGKEARMMMYFGYVGRDPASDAPIEMAGEKVSDSQTMWRIVHLPSPPPLR